MEKINNIDRYTIKNMKKYGIIYADPPWHYNQKNISGAAEHHYRTMNTEEICKLNVAEVADQHCTLFLWATFPQLPEALKVIKAWGFQYKTVAFVWLKQNKSGKGWFFGLGFWTRGNSEICLLATRGNLTDNQTVSISLLSVLCVSIVRNQMKSERKSLI